MTLEELIARLEKATGPDRELDADIARSLGEEVRYRLGATDYQRLRTLRPGVTGWVELPRYTSSIDSALTLVPEGWHVVDMGMPNPSMKMKMAVAVVGLNDPSDDDGDMPHGVHLTSIPIALCIAALKARAAQAASKQS